MEAHVAAYLDALEAELRTGSATEHSHRPALKALLEQVRAGYTATNEPRRIECGAPDLVVSRDRPHGRLTVGHVEAKDIGVAGGLEAVERSEQGVRYRQALPNLILTDYLRLRLYDDGEQRGPEVVLATVDGNRRRLMPVDGADARLLELLDAFFSKEPVRVKSPRDLAERLAWLAHLIRDVIVETFSRERASATLSDLRKAFADVLLPQLSVRDFADMFAQTLTYGMFAARVNHAADEPFSREHAAFEIPRTNPFLAHLFATINGPDLDDEPFIGLADDLAQLLADSDMESILRHFGARQRRQDPVVHFYETFLAAYDPKLREARGVYYTPEPVVSYIVRSVDEILRSCFDCPDGLADTQAASHGDGQDPRVLVLDPAVGTGTFLYGVVDHIREQFRESHNAGKWSGYVQDHLLPRVFGFELLMAPYAMAHLKLGLQLAAADLPVEERESWRYTLEQDQRLGVYLTNTLEEAIRRSDLLLGAYISEEANLAAEIKREMPIMVVLGNPPYSGHSANRGEWIRTLVQQEYVAGVEGLDRPAQAKWLQDDYVKFIRFGQWRIERSGAGVVAFITNHAYLDNPTFRGMRASLMRTFSDIYLLDLHGNANRRERDPDGGEDANVFDIKQGVAIALFVKRPGHAGPARIQRADVYGSRQAKYEWLDTHERASTPWRTIRPGAPLWLFTDEDPARRDEFYAGTSIARIFDQAGDPAPGIVTTHDEFAISFDRDEAIAKVERLLESTTRRDAERFFRLCSQDQWRYRDAKQTLGSSDAWRRRVIQIDYRPFDERVTVWDRHVAVHRRLRVSRHMVDGTNLALVSVGQVAESRWSHALVSRHPIDARLTTSNRGIAFELPLYLLPWPEDDPDRPIEQTLEGLVDERRPNLNPELMAELSSRLRLRFRPDGPGDLERDFGPEDVFHYIYAILHAPSYRERYTPFLKYDFAHVPLDVEAGRFRALAGFGRRLSLLHLLEAPELRVRRTSFPVPGDNVVAERHPVYLPPGEIDTFSGEPTTHGRVYINPNRRRPQTRGQYVEGVSLAAWEFEMGGYQVLHKWMRERRKRALRVDDIEHFERIVAAIEATIELLPAIDAAIGGWPWSPDAAPA